MNNKEHCSKMTANHFRTRVQPLPKLRV